MQAICFVVLCIPLLLLMAPPGPVAQSADDESEVRAVVEEFGRAFVEADVPILESLLTEDYLHVNGRSGNVLTREAWLLWIASRRAELDAGTLAIADYRIEEVLVRIHGDAAAVTGVAIANGERNEAAFASRVRFTNLWVRQEGVWRRAAFHDSPLPEKES